MERCDECGFSYDEGLAWSAGTAIVGEARAIAELLAGGGASVSARPAPGTWSPLEYACHVRDVLLVQRERVLLARQVDDLVPAPMGRDARADLDGYADQVPSDVARQLGDAAALFENVLDRLGDDWDRTMTYNYPVPTSRSLRWVAVHTLHEITHHRRDIERGTPT